MGKPLPRATVTAVAGNKRFSTTTDLAGRYILRLPAPGAYLLDVLLHPYQSAGKLEVDFDDGGPCRVQNIAMRTGNTISGRVWDRDGKVVRNAKVGLLDLDHPGDGRPVRTARTEEPDDRFELKNVPLGRYLLAVNAEGADAFETTYFPRGSTRHDAREIVITASGQHLKSMDLALGPPLVLRSVSVQVQFSDGIPMTMAHVRCEALPRVSGERRWQTGSLADKSGKAELQVPADRRIKLTVTDAYHRPLKREYVSVHESGAARIEQRFTIEP